MNKVAEPAAIVDHRLTLTEVMDALIAAGHVPAEGGETFKQERRYYKGDAHPLVVVAEQRWKSLKPPHKLMDMDMLTQWLAEWANMTYYHIDPLKINFSAVTEIMSNSYAIRFRVLPIEVKTNEVVIATTEPFQRSWEPELKSILSQLTVRLPRK